MRWCQLVKFQLLMMKERLLKIRSRVPKWHNEALIVFFYLFDTVSFLFTTISPHLNQSSCNLLSTDVDDCANHFSQTLQKSCKLDQMGLRGRSIVSR